MKKIYFIALLMFCNYAYTQNFDITAEVRPRFENKHGFGTLIENDVDGTNFVSQRTRLNFNFSNTKLKTRIILQNVRVWGDVGTLSSNDKANALHEAWAEAIISNKTSLKIGRQEIAYDDQRIFGSVGWAQQARSHDALLFKYKPNNKNRLDIGIALNADSQSGIDNLYSNAAGYKSFQYAWYHTNQNNFGISILALNTSIEYLKNAGLTTESITKDYMQTLGARVTYKSSKFKANAATYLQTGKSLDRSVSASYFTGNIDYKLNDKFNIGFGVESLSGKDTNDSSSKVKSFAPLFGTNHKFNGLMDYFYVGNHANSIGLIDANATISYKKDTFLVKLMPHLFSSQASVFNGLDEMDKKLGTEIDIVLGYKISKEIAVNAGHSMMFATETMEFLKGGDKDATNSWSWIMVTFKPKVFSTKKI